MALGDELFKEGVAYGARCLLDGLWLASLAGVGDAAGDVGAVDVQGDFEALAE